MKTKYFLSLVIILCIPGLAAYGQAKDYRLADKPFTVEYYYKIKWGYFDEFMELYMKNHWPSIESSIKTGDFLSAKIERPFNHVGEADRWDLRVTVVWKNALMAFGLDDFDMEAFNRKLYPDQERWKKEEQRRFELIDEHMDVQVYEV
ncbi:MAG: hypothetical protein AAGF85_20945, partial [Bacteroidota bacterium]